MRIFSWSAALLLLVLPLHGAVPLKPEDQRSRVEQPLQVEGQFTGTEARDAVTMLPSKVYPHAMRKGHIYVIDMISRDFDAFLRVESPLGAPLAQDDDSGGNLNARLRFVAPDDGNFRVIATAFNGGIGKYTLKVQPLGPPEPRGKETKVHTVGKGGLTLESDLGKDDERDTARRASPCKVYQVRLAAGKTYKIDLESKDFDTYLRVEDDGNRELAKDDDSGEGTNSRLAFRPQREGVYRVIATSFAAGISGNFRLRVREE